MPKYASVREMRYLRYDKIYTSNIRLKKSRKAGQKQTSQEISGDLFIPGGGGQFYGYLHTTGNLQGNFAIFAIKTNFAPRLRRIFSTPSKIFPKQITGNLFQKTSFSLIF